MGGGAKRLVHQISESRARSERASARSAVSGTTHRAITVRWVVPLTALRAEARSLRARLSETGATPDS